MMQVEETRISVQAIRGKFEQLHDTFTPPPVSSYRSVSPKNDADNQHNRDEQQFAPSERLKKLADADERRRTNILVKPQPENNINNGIRKTVLSRHNSGSHLTESYNNNKGDQNEKEIHRDKTQSRSKSFGNKLQFDNELSNALNKKSTTSLEHLDKKCSKFTHDSDQSDFVTFAGKQKLIDGVVRNMKNNNHTESSKDEEKTKFIKLRKFSITSKLEKDLKNKIEKHGSDADHNSNILLNNKKENKPSKCDIIEKKSIEKGKSVLESCIESAVNSVIKVAAAVTDVDTKKRLSKEDVADGKEIVKATLPIPSKENDSCDKSMSSNDSVNVENVEIVLERRLSQYDNVVPTEIVNTSNTCENLPPTRPPRRKHSNGGWAIPKKKHKAPSPPADASPKKIDSDSLVHHKPSSYSHTSNDDRISINVEITETNISKALPNSEQSISSESNDLDSSTPKENINEDVNESEEKTDNPESLLHSPSKVVLPPGPPPKKPPRTFEYEIYKEMKMKKTISTPDCSTNITGPIYAQPNKKKSNNINDNTKLFGKPPSSARSKPDLSQREIEKPIIAPKPINVVNKSKKRLSMVENLINTETKESQDASDFQRQAHMRFSLRKPKEAPPAPPDSNNQPVEKSIDEQPHSLELWPSGNKSELNSYNNQQVNLRKKSMSDETLYKGRTTYDDPIYEDPSLIMRQSKKSPELHYMCSVLYQDRSSNDNEGKFGLHRKNRRGDLSISELNINKTRPNIISLWTQEFRQSCRQVQNKFKKNVGR